MKTSTAIKKLPMAITLAAISASTVVISKAEAAGIIQIDPLVNPLQGPGYVIFDEISFGSNPPIPGNNYDNILRARNWIIVPGGFPVLDPNPDVVVEFAERFVNQQIEYAPDPTNGPFDVVPDTPTPTNPLALQVGDPNQNLNIASIDKVLSGLGPLGFPSNDAIGEGAIAILFPLNQSQFGFFLGGTSGGSTTVKFWGRDGSLIDTFVLDSSNPFGYEDQDYAFESTLGDVIAGVSITNFDTGGIFIDNIIYNNPGTPPPQNVPESSSVLGLLAIGALGGGLKLKGKLKR